METPLNKEQVYDAQINPLMAQIIEICQTNKIAFVASFSIPNEGDETLACTTALLTAETEPPQNLVDALRVLRGGRRALRAPFMLRTENGDGTTTLTAIAT
ncbi:hypothetical protein LMG24238_06946 [Paraburkholderia sediminicola]|uniref:Uncharacterized protein n=1 Tax=Paraburkholderia sediminicola TaxID=458836 RepID=A0A6J5CPA1_9BURK|nr:hypothetical protein [Paraburkholderia sediminicola]CAB3742821.1 hypothetical protein LMG24238_06946 [Paraburkholderia sediminicola]